MERTPPADGLIGQSIVVKGLQAALQRVAAVESTELLTGKECGWQNSCVLDRPLGQPLPQVLSPRVVCAGFGGAGAGAGAPVHPLPDTRSGWRRGAIFVKAP